MKNNKTITITRAEYTNLNKAANAAVEHACKLFQAARLVDELKARIAELEAARDELEKEEIHIPREFYKYLIQRGPLLWERIDHMENENNELKARIAELEAARDEWFSKYQVLKDRTDNYDFLLHKTREQETEIYRLVKEINELGG
jgi:chromosome segregation ATPase